MLSIVLNIITLSLAVALVANLLPGIKLKGFGTAIVVALVYSVINFLLYKILVFFSFPFILISFGLFLLVINAVLLWLTDLILDDFEIDGFGTTFVASLLITLANFVMKWILGLIF